MAARGTQDRNHEKSAQVILVYTAIALTLIEYWFHPAHIEAWLNNQDISMWMAPSLKAGILWSIACFTFYFLGPFIYLKTQGWTVKELGLNPAGFLKHIKVYLFLFALMLPVIYLASTQPSFKLTYPFIREATEDTGKFLFWEIFYLLQFFSLESFFRGSLLFSLEKSIGKLAIFVMTIPYTMIHFHKPMIETIGAIGAGLILGHLSLKYRSWLGGAILHGLVAISMDLLAQAN